MHPMLIQQVAEYRIQDLLREGEAARVAHQVRDARRTVTTSRSRRARGDEDEVTQSASQPALV